ncbi:Tetracycline resistance protein, class C [Candidatus Zixiibacteriota bacterium]|nr:Tetracycline resistance protein, class C [candidate division Zixibacteria bacterium]
MTPSSRSKNDSVSLKHILRALNSRNYRLFFGGQGVSLIGTWMQRIALSWLVYRLTNSPFLLGLVSFSGQIPTFLLAPVAGVLADRMNRLKLVIAAQILSMIQAFLLAFLVLTKMITTWEIIVLSIFLGLVNAFEITARQSLVVEMIDKKEDLGNAIALNSSIFNGARLVGPSIAGILIAAVGEGVCFLLNGISFGAVIAALMMMKLKPIHTKPKNDNMLKGLKEGFAYTFGFPPLRSILLMVALVNLMGMPYVVLLPVFARDILHGGPNTLGFLMGATGVGALSGALFLAARKSVVGLGKWIPIAAGTLGGGLILFCLSRHFVLSIILMLPIGFGMMVNMASSNTLLQTIVDDDKRGRLMSQYAMAFMGMAPLGSLWAGAAAGRIGAPLTLIIGGLICILAALIFARNLPAMRKLVHPIYHRKGILPEIAVGYPFRRHPTPVLRQIKLCSVTAVLYSVFVLDISKGFKNDFKNDQREAGSIWSRV